VPIERRINEVEIAADTKNNFYTLAISPWHDAFISGGDNQAVLSGGDGFRFAS
jgi:hypothetical protein